MPDLAKVLTSLTAWQWQFWLRYDWKEGKWGLGWVTGLPEGRKGVRPPQRYSEVADKRRDKRDGAKYSILLEEKISSLTPQAPYQHTIKAKQVILIL